MQTNISNIKVLKVNAQTDTIAVFLLKKGKKNYLYKGIGLWASMYKGNPLEIFYLQEYLSKILNLIGIKNPVLEVIDAKEVIKELNDINEDSELKERLLKELESYKKVLKMEYYPNTKELWDCIKESVHYEYSDESITTIGKIIIGEYFLSITDRHAGNYLAKIDKEHKTIIDIYPIDLEDANIIRGTWKLRWWSELENSTLTQILKTEQLSDDVRLIEGAHQIKQNIMTNRQEILKITNKYVKEKKLNPNILTGIEKALKFLDKYKTTEIIAFRALDNNKDVQREENPDYVEEENILPEDHFFGEYSQDFETEKELKQFIIDLRMSKAEIIKCLKMEGYNHAVIFKSNLTGSIQMTNIEKDKIIKFFSENGIDKEKIKKLEGDSLFGKFLNYGKQICQCKQRKTNIPALINNLQMSNTEKDEINKFFDYNNIDPEILEGNSSFDKFLNYLKQNCKTAKKKTTSKKTTSKKTTSKKTTSKKTTSKKTTSKKTTSKKTTLTKK